MSMRQCIVCKREVPQGYERDHIASNHLGPHIFWFNGQEFTVMEPSMSVGEIKRLADSSYGYQFFEERDGENIYFGDSESVDLTNRPHFHAVPPATMFRARE